jgi:hypothetical protein
MTEYRYESELQAAIIKAASERGHRLFDNRIGVAKYRNKGREYTVPYGVGGPDSPDLWGWNSRGEAAIPEVKLPGKKPRKGQLAWMAAGKRSCPNLRIGWVDSVEGAMILLEGPLNDPDDLYYGP